MQDFLSTMDKLHDLVSRFKYNIDAYKSGAYNETQVRREFIDPFFKLLSWDVDNEQSFAEAYKDVVHEDAIKIGGKTKAPDYCFRIGGTRKFFVEAKKPSINIKDEPHPAYQLRRYGWSAKLPLSILTDFEEFAVYDCRIKPEQSDTSSKARVKYFTYDQYESKWDEISSIFARNSILKGSFDKYADETKSKKGTTEVDAAFLEEISSWREILARNIAIRNPSLSQKELNYSVQMTIDRIIFLRICEDRGIENYGRLHDLQKYKDIYKELTKLFQQADDRYNSGLFHFRKEKDNTEAPDDLTLNLIIDDKTIKDILKNLYYPESPYEFSVLPAEILGQIYEQFLGKVITVSPGRKVSVEEKPEVKKAGGVYYTPTYIVDYIVKETIGKLLEGKKPDKVKEIAILDPACGSGSFLIGAYQYLLDWHKNWYVENNPEKHMKGKEPKLYQTEEGDWALTTSEKRRILLDNIYGVDIDHSAVEVTKLSLLLKVLEGESDQRLATQLKMFQERALPNLSNNIKCGNSLVGTDFYDTFDISSLEPEELYKINPFDWEKEFSKVFLGKVNSGFDVVIGNPPYVRQETLGPVFKEYAQKHFSSYTGTADLYVYFFEQSHKILCNGGFFGMICSNKFMRSNYGKGLREFLLKKTAIRQIIDFGELPVFKKAATFPAIFIFQNETVQKQDFYYAPIKKLSFISLYEEIKKVSLDLDSKAIEGDNWTLAKKNEVGIFEKMKQIGIPFKKYINTKIYYGIKTGLNEAFIITSETKEKLITEDPKSLDIMKPFIIGDDVRKYHIKLQPDNYKFLIFMPNGWTRINSKNSLDPWKWLKKTYPAIVNHLSQFADAGQKRCDKGEYWWELRTCDYYPNFEKPKIMWSEIAKESRFTFYKDTLFFNNACFFIPIDDLYLLGLLNSKIIWFYLKSLCPVLGDADKGGRLTLRKVYMELLPIRSIDFSNPSDKNKHSQITELVNRMLLWNQQLKTTKTPQEKTILQRQIEATDKQIDHLVYELYELTEEEIKIIEGSDG